MKKMATVCDRYVAAMVLSGVGDAMGYKNGNWEFCHSGIEIHKEADALGGIKKLKIKLPDWKVSDDTVMHLATAEAYVKTKDIKDKEQLYKNIAKMYKECMKDMCGRAPGATTTNAMHMLKPWADKGYQIPFDPRGGGCGAAMRAMCIGLVYPRPEDLPDLIADGIESGRMTHHHPTGFLGSMTVALFTSYAIQDKPLEQWGAGLMETLPKAKEYIEKNGHEARENIKSWDYFTNAWSKYLEIRQIKSGCNPPVFPEKYDIQDRDAFYKSLSFAGWGGASGHDSPMIAYDAMLGSKDSWIELCKRGILHSGDNDSTGVMAGCWFGAKYGIHDVPKNHYEKLEYRNRLEKAGKDLFKLSESNHLQSQTGCITDGPDVSHSDDNKDNPLCSGQGEDQGGQMPESVLSQQEKEKPKANDEEMTLENPSSTTPDVRKSELSSPDGENSGLPASDNKIASDNNISEPTISESKSNS